MAQDGIFQGEMDPEIAELLGTSVPKAGVNQDSVPNYESIFKVGGEIGRPPEGGEAPEVDLTVEHFPPVTKRFESTPHAAFNDPAYYKASLSGEGDIAQRVHTILQKYLTTKDPKDRSVYRQQFITAYWDFFAHVAKKSSGKLPGPKKYLLRFGILHPALIDAETRDLFGKAVVANELNQPIFYLDEWFKNVGSGVVRNSSTDEVRVARNNSQMRLQQLLEKAQGKLDGARLILKAKNEERFNLEKVLQDRISIVLEHYPVDGLHGVQACYSEPQKRVFGDIQEVLKGLLKIDHELDLNLKDYYQSDADVRSLQQKVEEEGGAVQVDARAVDTEIETVRQMAKMTIGRQGNHYPILSGEYFHCGPNDVGFRENIIAELTFIESIDPEAFCRSYKNRLNRIVPYVVLIPSYGDTGVCWEPLDRFNRATSRGRIAIPMYPKSLHIAVLSAVADLRWQVAKEKASYYWMEEGITGNYYQWFNAQKLKGDVKEFFIQDYIAWMTKESEGIQKLNKEVRGIFWRHMPFSKEVKEKLKTRSYVYQDLYQRDVNRSLSDGY
ncbi:MAG: hypothetical protein LBL64_02175 [Treponema sp.]|jgi:hypothetical protein|nr:hypothetical protein [Treponema sp.]